MRLQDRVNALSEAVHGRKVFPLYSSPSVYTGELFGVEYLYQQSGTPLLAKDEDVDSHIDEGFEDFVDCPPELPSGDSAEEIITPVLSDSEDEEEDEEKEVRVTPYGHSCTV